MQHSSLFKITSFIAIALLMSSCSRMPTTSSTMQKFQPTMKRISNGAISVKNKVVSTTPRLFKRKPRYPAALPLTPVKGKHTCCTTSAHRSVVINNKAMQTNRDTNTVSYAKPVNSQTIVSKKQVPQPALPQATPRVVLASYAPLSRSAPATPSISPQQANSQLFNLSKTGTADQIQQLIRQGASTNSANTNGETALHASASTGNVAAANALIQNGANVNALTVRGWTPLHTAARFGKSEVASLLISRGADLNIRNQDGKTPIQLARQAGQSNTVALLLR